MPKHFITLQHVDVRVGGHLVLHNISWTIDTHQQWVVSGPNGSGKTTLMKALWEEVPVVNGTIRYGFPSKKHTLTYIRNKIGYVSFELHEYIAREDRLRQELQSYSHKQVSMLKAGNIISSHNSKQAKAAIKKYTSLLGITHLLERPAIALSTGEMRKLLIVRALVKKPVILILDEPFDGLDERSRKEITEIIQTLIHDGLQIILITHRLNEIPEGMTHMLELQNGNVMYEGLMRSSRTHLPAGVTMSIVTKEGPNPLLQREGIIKLKQSVHTYQKKRALIALNNIKISYGHTTILKNFSWTMHGGEHWAIVGPNGSGKSTIVKLITGENLQGYANDITLFGKPKYELTREEINKNVRVVSAEQQVSYSKHITALEVLYSGFFNSHGLYQNTSEKQKSVAAKLIQLLNIQHIVDKQFQSLSYGQKRMILIARAIVNRPMLLILDEPYHGLDEENRKKVADIIDSLPKKNTSVIFITHHKEEIPAFITRILSM